MFPSPSAYLVSNTFLQVSFGSGEEEAGMSRPLSEYDNRNPNNGSIPSATRFPLTLPLLPITPTSYTNTHGSVRYDSGTRERNRTGPHTFTVTFTIPIEILQLIVKSCSEVQVITMEKARQKWHIDTRLKSNSTSVGGLRKNSNSGKRQGI